MRLPYILSVWGGREREKERKISRVIDYGYIEYFESCMLNDQIILVTKLSIVDSQ